MERYGTLRIRDGRRGNVIASLRTIQVLLGHADIQTTARYLRVSTARIQAAPNPFDSLQLKPIDLSKDDGRQR